MSVLPFRITISPANETGSFPVHASAGSSESESVLELPEDLLLQGEQLLLPYASLPIEDLAGIGRQLGRALFTPRLRGMLLEQARAAAQISARVQIQLQINVPELAALPWEWLAIGTGRPWVPGLRTDYTIVRIGRRASPAAPIVVEGPLRILAAAGPGQRAQLDALAEALADAIRSRLISLDLLPDTDLDEIRQTLAQRQFHILHLAAPAALTPDQRMNLAIGRGIDGFDLADLLAEYQTLRLVTLTGSSGDSQQLSAAAALFGAILMSEQIPAAVTLSANLAAGAIARFAAVLYEELADGAPADLAVSLGRRALDGSGEPCWGAAQLRSLPGADQLFSFRPTPRPTMTPKRLLPIAIVATLLVALLLAGNALINQRQSSATAQGILTPTSASTPGFVLPNIPALLPTATQTMPVPTSLPDPVTYITYAIVPSDTLELIATTTGSDANAIAHLNQIEASSNLRPGRQLVVPVYREGAANAGGQIVNRGNPSQRIVALTFDVEIDDTSVYSILEALRAHNMKATFFVTGRWVQAFPEAARAILHDGHEFGNHSYTHPYFSRIGYDGATEEINATERAVRDITGATTRPYFRFPYGDSTADMLTLLAKNGYIAYHWSTDEAGFPNWLAQAITNPSNANGAIILMHGRAASAALLPGWLDQLVAAGFHATTLSETLR
jgi:peptidoglycan/xylan/chitin deacetylase (PgdA/CDA1 family)